MDIQKVMKEHFTQRQRQCVQLYYFNRKTQREAGAILGICQTTVCQHIHAGFKKLRYLLGRNQDEYSDRKFITGMLEEYGREYHINGIL